MNDGVDKRQGFGISARERPGHARLGRRVEELGYHELWSNDPGRASGLAVLAESATQTSTLDLGVGVISLADRTPESIADEARAVGLPLERLIVGVGSGGSRSVDLVRSGVLALRDLLPGVRLAVAAMGPRMCRLAGELSDVVLLNWNVPDRVAWSRERVAEGAAAAGRTPPRVAAYVRVTIGPDAEARLEREAERYRRSTPAYAQAFARQEIDLRAIGVAAASAADVAPALDPYRSVLDTCIARGLPATDDVDAWIELAEAAAPR